MISTTERNPQLTLKTGDFQRLFTTEGLSALDQQFIDYLSQCNETLAAYLPRYRDGKLSALEISEWIIATAPIVEQFIAELFCIESAVSELTSKTLFHDPIFIFKDHYVHAAKRLLKSSVADSDYFCELNAWVFNQIEKSDDLELAIATVGVLFLSDEKYLASREKLIQWCVQVQLTSAGQCIIKQWRSFHVAQKKQFEQLVPMVPVKNDPFGRFEGPHESQRNRDGFALTDTRMDLRSVLDEIHYCVYCHKNEGDFCSKGFPVKKNNPALGLKTNPVGDILTGCPLEEKISEMHVVKKSGYGIGALAIVTIDNPMCAVTGHRICNDCMKACIYQKQDPVNIPEIETRVLTDVLHLPWGVEIYDLLIRWNPLRQTQFYQAAYNGKKVLVMGMGPAGFTMSHHLLMEGFAVVGADGLKIEPLLESIIANPIYDFNTLTESLDDRIMTGFGGVAEYGITVRWDKNFLKLIYLSLSRRHYFQILGNVRLGGTITIEDAWELGFDHVVIAVGAGLPKELSIPNSLASGMRQANDFLMGLQLSGAVKKSSVANLQMRLPAIVIGGGLTGIDTATEAQAYYITQVEKIHQRYHMLKAHYGESTLRTYFDAESSTIIDEFLSHADAIIAQRMLANTENRAPHLNALIRQWGGVTIAYRKSMTESPAYQRNHEEVIKALQEGIYYAEGLEPAAVVLDEYGACSGLLCRWRIQNEVGEWVWSSEQQTLPAKSIFVATGATPNIAYAFEHRDTFVRMGNAYQGYKNSHNQLTPVDNKDHLKSDTFGIFTSYYKNDHRVSFIGDTNPAFHGSVVKAIASAKLGYPAIVESMKTITADADKKTYHVFREKISNLFSATVIAVKRHSKNTMEISVKSIMAAKQFKPGQFYRLQNYETHAETIENSLLQTETIAALGIVNSENPDVLSFFISENGASTKIMGRVKPGQLIALMGPTGAKTKIPDAPQDILIVGDAMAIPYLLSVGPALIAAGHRIYFIVLLPEKNLYAIDRIRALTDHVTICEEDTLISCIQSIDSSDVKTISVIASARLLKMIQNARNTVLQNKFPEGQWTASVYGSMQCMLKGVCAQCLQWQIDPHTGKRTKAVYACSWQHQPMEIVDIDNIDERLGQNKAQEILTNLWVDYLLQKENKHV